MILSNKSFIGYAGVLVKICTEISLANCAYTSKGLSCEVAVPVVYRLLFLVLRSEYCLIPEILLSESAMNCLSISSKVWG